MDKAQDFTMFDVKIGMANVPLFESIWYWLFACTPVLMTLKRNASFYIYNLASNLTGSSSSDHMGASVRS